MPPEQVATERPSQPSAVAPTWLVYVGDMREVCSSTRSLSFDVQQKKKETRGNTRPACPPYIPTEGAHHGLRSRGGRKPASSPSRDSPPSPPGLCTCEGLATKEGPNNKYAPPAPPPLASESRKNCITTRGHLLLPLRHRVCQRPRHVVLVSRLSRPEGSAAKAAGAEAAVLLATPAERPPETATSKSSYYDRGWVSPSFRAVVRTRDSMIKGLD